MKRLVMEFGGHAPLIIFDDADVERAVDVAMAAKFGNVRSGIALLQTVSSSNAVF